MNGGINLLPMGFRRRLAAREIAIGWFLASSLVAITLMMWWVGRSDDELPNRIAALEKQAGPIIAMKQRTASLKKELQRLRDRAMLLDLTLPSDDVLQTIGAISVACKKTDSSVRVQSLDLKVDHQSRLKLADASNKSPKKKVAPEGSQLILHIQASDDQYATDLITHLKEHPRFGRIEFKNASDLRDGTARVVELHSDVITTEQLP